MKVLLSWSGSRSKEVALALEEWLPLVLQQVETWMSRSGIEPGLRWSNELTKALADCRVSVICLTAENQKVPWILFEAGASSMVSVVIPYLINIRSVDVEPPLSQFQSAEADQEGTLRLLKSINDACGGSIPPERLATLFETWWPRLERKLELAAKLTEDEVPPSQRSDSDILREILPLVRAMAAATLDSQPVAPEVVSVEVDSTPLLAEKGRVWKMRMLKGCRVTVLLDGVWNNLDDVQVPVWTYGKVWLLRNCRTGKVYNDIGVEYCTSRGNVPDYRLIGSLDIADGDRLEVISAKNPQ